MKKLIHRYIGIIKTVYTFSRSYIVYSLIIHVLNLVNTYLLLYINKLMIDNITDFILNRSYDVSRIIMYLLLCMTIEMISVLFTNIFQYKFGKTKLIYDDNMLLNLTKNVAALDMAYYDDPKSYDMIQQAGKYKSSILNNFNSLIDLIFSLVSFIIAIYISMRFSILITIISIISMIPTTIIQRTINYQQYQMEKDKTNKQRYLDYLIGLFYNRHSEMEMQLYDFSSYIFEKIKDIQREFREILLNLTLRKAMYEGSLFVFNKFIEFTRLLITIMKIVNLGFTVGDYSYYSGIGKNLTSSLNAIVSHINNIHINNIKYDEYEYIITRKPYIQMDGTLAIMPSQSMEFEFRHVYFKYPNSTQFVIKDLSLKLNMGEKIALVGQNGSGKSTLIKLLLRYYDPTEGEILLNGVNIKLYQLDQYRKLFSSMFQDPLMYMLTIRENITLSNVANDEQENDSRFEQLLTDLHINEADGSYLEMNKFYGKQFFSDGYILSKGQQQKIFAARTLYRDASIYILDEPAVSMDALSEQDFLCSLDKYSNSKTVIYITHRYHNLHKMDRIIVLDSGMVIEE